jgi:hypothetical protein
MMTYPQRYFRRSLPGHTGLPDIESVDATAKETDLHDDLGSNTALAVTFAPAPIFFALFSLSGKTNGPIHRIKECEQSVGVWQPSFWFIGKRSSAYPPSDWPNSPNTWLFVAMWSGSCSYLVWYPQQDCSFYDAERQTFHLQGALCNILGEDRLNLSTVVIFSSRTRVDRFN